MLGIETATGTGGVALADAAGLLGTAAAVPKSGHARTLMDRVHRLLSWCGVAKTDLEGIAVSVGPGSFTGVRVGLSTAKGLAFGLDLPLVGVTTLDALASAVCWQNSVTWTVLDAKRGQVFVAAYSSQERLFGPAVLEPEQAAASMQDLGGPVVLVGDGSCRYKAVFERRIGEAATFAPLEFMSLLPGMVARIGRTRLCSGESDEPAGLLPLYLREPDIRKGS